MIPALVLTAGLATRLRPLSFVRAKAAMPVAGQPLVQRILRWLASAGVADAVLNLHHLPETITGVVGNGAADGLRVRYSWETPVLGSAGGPRHALSLLDSSAFLIVNGDTLTNVDVAALVADHTRSGALVTMAVIPNTDPDKYGGLAVDATGTFTGVVSRGSRQSSYHFVGVQVAEAEAFATLPDNRPFESVRQLYPTLIATRPGSVRTFVSSAEFFDIGTPADYLNTSLAFAARESHESRIPLDSARGKPSPQSRLDDCVVWDDVEVDDDVRLRRCILTDGVRVPARSSWENMTIRVAHGELMQTERLVGELAIGPINGSTLR
jgi:mannose-1-phosphate guanylyltransferase